jgi:hypothetical protein
MMMPDMANRSPALTLARNAGVACVFGVLAPLVVLGIFAIRSMRAWGGKRATQVRTAAKSERAKWR